MNTLKTGIAVAAFLSFAAVSSAQTLTTAQRRSYNAKLLELADSYSFSSTFYDESSRNAFLGLFVDGDSPVVSDMMEHSFGKAIPASEYASEFSSRQSVSVIVSNLRRGDYRFERGAWHCTLSFDKQISYNDENGVLFSTQEYYGAPVQCEISCVYDKADGVFKIESISSSVLSDVKDLPDTFDVLEKSNAEDAKLKVDGKPLKFNSFDQAFVRKNAIDAWNDDVRIKREYYARTDRYDYFRQSYRFTHFRARVHASLAAGGSMKVTSETPFSTVKSTGYQAGAELGYTVPAGKVLTIGLFAGAGYSYSSLHLGMSDISYSYMVAASSGIPYTRKYDISIAEDRLSFKDIYVPVYLNFDIRLMKKLLLGIDAGVKFYFTGVTHADPFHVSGTVSGDLASPSAEDSFGDFDISTSSFLYPGSYSRDKYDYSFMAGLSLNYDVYAGLVYVYAKCDFEMGLKDLHKGFGTSWFSEESVYPVIHSSLGGGSNVVSRSFANNVSYRRMAFWPEIGLMFKF